MSEKIYYEIQDGWEKDEYYYLHRCLHRMLFYYKRFSEEIASLDLSKMSAETKVLMYCIIKYYHYEFLLEQYDNLAELKDTQPLNHELVIDDSTVSENDIYKQMNVVY